MQFTDSHCHLDDVAFTAQLPQLLAQCQQLAINRIIVPAISPKNFDNVLTLAKTHHNKPINIYPCLGIHPWFLQGLTDIHLEQLTALIAKSKNNIIAIGEIGLDGAIAKNAEAYGQTVEKSWQHQQHFFDYQLNIAKEQNLPVIVHHRQSHDKIMPFLKRYKLENAGIIHGFSGSYQQAMGYIDLGFKLGIGSTITYSRAKKTINAIKRLPLSSLVLETDAPSMPLSKEILNKDELSSIDGNKTNTPANSPINIIKIFNVLAAIREEDSEQIADQLESNIEQIFFNSFRIESSVKS
ncbi:TatD family deoxyribonuclease [Colwellia echini]|uniref:TatD family deoxyribonuclease n=2 Tax=Colwellia echini TaxID=1982103 RepID=A0ABY3MXP7_9GAMM|nr:TatD family deoxyribonuclease [Colwellia echini]